MLEERYQLRRKNDRLELHDTIDKSIGPVSVDFLAGKNYHRRKFGGGKGQALARAIGLHKFKQPWVVDATAGLGRESFVLASLGCKMTLLERNPTVHALLEDGLQRATQSNDPDLLAIISRITLINLDALDWLSQKFMACPSVIYLDPMFPQRTKSALVQKEMRFFHNIVGEDPDSNELLSRARTIAEKRVVVKRPTSAKELANSKPDFVIPGKTIRYDVYLPHACSVNTRG